MMTGLNAAQTDERTDTFAVDTGVGETDADVVLVADLFNNSLISVTDITSNCTTDNPLPDDYTSTSNTLSVRGLDTDTSRTLEVTYQYDALTGDSAPASTFMGLVPLFVIVAAVVILVASGIGGFMYFRGRGG